MSQPQLWYANGVDQAVFTRPGSGSPVLLAHATSFHARCWNQVIAHLPGVPVVAYDLRGHGLSTKVEPPADWFAFGRDLIALVDRLDLRDVVAVGHSMGGHSVVMAAAQRPDRFAALLLIDPVIWPRAIYHQQHFTSHPSRRRRNEWASPDEMFERFKDRSPFNRWQPAVLRDYCDYALLPNPYGSGYILACSPRFEESIYLNGFEPDLYDQIPAVTARTRVLRSGRQDAAFAVDMSISPTAPDLAAQFRHGEDVLLRDFSHFIPMEAPELVAGHIRAMRGD